LPEDGPESGEERVVGQEAESLGDVETRRLVALLPGASQPSQPSQLSQLGARGIMGLINKERRPVKAITIPARENPGEEVRLPGLNRRPTSIREAE